MAYNPIPAFGVQQQIADTSTIQLHPIGLRIEAQEMTLAYGVGEFIYLKGVASTAIGMPVIFDQYAGTTKLAVAGDRGPVAIAMSANVANQFGWYQIAGSAVVKSNPAVANARPYLTSTAGTADDAVVAGDAFDGARYKTADGTPSAGFAIWQIARPCLNGNG